MIRLSSLRARPLFPVLFATLLPLLISGCGDDEASPPELEAAREVLGTMLAVQESHESEGILGFIEKPLSAVTGNYSALGALGEIGLGAQNLSEAWSLGKQLTGGLAHWRTSARIFSQRDAVLGKALSFGFQKAECDTIEFTGGFIEVCVEPLEGTIVEVVATQHNDEPDDDGVVFIRWALRVDTLGTAQEDDDLVLAMDSEIRFDDGSEVLGSVRPVEDPALGDNTLVSLTEVVRYASGIIAEQTNIITLDLGVADIDGDETIWELSSVLDFRNGARNSIVVSELNLSDGIRDDDQLVLEAEFTAPPGDRRIESISATIWIDVVDLENDSDDLYGQVSQTIVLDGNTRDGGIPTVFDVYDPDGWVALGEEPTGGTFTRNASFPSDQEATLLTHTVSYDVAAGGSSELDVEFADGTSFALDIAWNNDGTAMLNATNRDESTLAGSFDSNADSFTLTTTYPQGHELSHVVQSGSSDGVTREYTVVATYGDGHTETLDITSTLTDGVRTVTGMAVTTEGTSTFAASFDVATGVLTGSATGPDGATLDYTLTPLGDGRRLLQFAGNDPNEDVTVTGTVLLQPDGSGCGVVRIARDGVSRRAAVCFEADGSGTVGGELSL